jgi:sugar lactone lactonase YvrE
MIRALTIAAVAVFAAGCFDFDRLGRAPDGGAGDRDLGGGPRDLATGDEDRPRDLALPDDFARTDLRPPPDLMPPADLMSPPLVVTPLSFSIVKGAGRQLSANLPVSWLVEEAGGGTIDTSGHYTAPSGNLTLPATFHIDAKTKSGPTQTVRVTVTVVADGISVLLGAPGGQGNYLDVLADSRFSYPVGVGLDGSGNVYVGDWNNALLDRITPGGSIIAYDDDFTTVKQPSGIALDGAGSLCFADADSYGVYCATVGAPADSFTLRAGSSGTQGTQDGTGTGAQFTSPYGLTGDGTGNLYVTDRGAGSIRSISKMGVTATLVTGLTQPGGITFAAPSTLYFADGGGGGRVASVDTGTKVVTTVNSLTGARGVAWDAGTSTLYANTSTGIFTVTTTFITLIAGSPTINGTLDANSTSARFFAMSLMVSDGNGTLYVADTANCTVRKIVAAFPTPVTTYGPPLPQAGLVNGTAAQSRLYAPAHMTFAGGNLYIADAGNNVIRKWDGTNLSTFSGSGNGVTGSTDTPPRYFSPHGITSDGTYLYVTDSVNDTLRRIALSDGTVTTVAGTPLMSGTADGDVSTSRLYDPLGVVFDGSDTLYIADASNNSIRTFAISTGMLGTLLGGFNRPAGVFFDGTNLWVSDFSGLSKVTLGATPSSVTITGSPTYVQSQIAGDGSGDLYFADNSGVVWKYNIANAILGAVAGTPNEHSLVQGALPGVLNEPSGLVFDPTGALLVTDSYENDVLLLRVP